VGFIAGESEISVSISLKRSYDYIHSMIINPRTDEIFEAYNSISLLNGQQIKTYSGTLAELTRGVSTCAYVTGTRIQLAKEVMGRAFKARIPLRISGGSALDLCRVAEGKSYAHVCLGAHHWDVEAGIHILKNAGGAVEILELFPDRMALAFIGASSRDVLEELRTTLQI
jgi:myo-inositol-1(or 4)-monophosphatase